jgi:hypothetical protein
MREAVKKYRGTIIGIIFIIVGMLLFYVFQIYELWGDPRDAGPSGFCEYFDPNLLVGEPINAWSNFYYVGAGMIVLIYYDLLRMGKAKRKDTYIDKDEHLHYFITYGLLVVWVGIASFYMHASYRTFGLISAGFLDVLSMNMYLSGLFIMSLAILFDIRPMFFYIILIVDIILMVIIMKIGVPFPSFGGGGLFEFLFILVLTSDVILSLGIYSKIFKKLGARQVRRNTIIIFIIIGCFLTAYWLWHFGKRDAPSCDPFSWWQWHAVWHFITAFCTILIAMYIRTEKVSKPA